MLTDVIGRGQLRPVLAFLTAAFAASQLAMRAARPPQYSPDLIGPAIEGYRGVAAQLPSCGRIGFLPTTENGITDTVNYYVAQYALAPRVLLNPFDSTTSFVVSGVFAPPTITGHAQLKGYEFVGSAEHGIQVFRRSP